MAPSAIKSSVWAAGTRVSFGVSRTEEPVGNAGLGPHDDAAGHRCEGLLARADHSALDLVVVEVDAKSRTAGNV